MQKGDLRGREARHEALNLDTRPVGSKAIASTSLANITGIVKFADTIGHQKCRFLSLRQWVLP